MKSNPEIPEDLGEIALPENIKQILSQKIIYGMHNFLAGDIDALKVGQFFSSLQVTFEEVAKKDNYRKLIDELTEGKRKEILIPVRGTGNKGRFMLNHQKFIEYLMLLTELGLCAGVDTEITQVKQKVNILLSLIS